MSYIQKGLHGMSIILVFTILGSLISYATRAILARTLTPAEFGLFYSALTFFLFVGILPGFGFGESLPKYLSEYLAQKKHANAWYLFWFSVSARTVLSILACVLIFLWVPFLSTSYFKTPQAEGVLITLILAFPLLTFARTLYSTAQGFQRSALMGFIGVAEKLFFPLLLILALVLVGPMTPLIVAQSYLATFVLVILIFLFPVLRLLRSLPREDRPQKRMIVSKTLTFGIFSMMGSVGWLIIGYIDVIMLTYFRPLAEVGVYSTILPTVLVLSIFSKSIFAVFFPMVSELWAKGLNHKVSEGIDLITKYSLILMIPVFAIVFSFSHLLIRVLFGEQYVSGALAMQVLSISILFYGVGQIYQYSLQGMGYPQKVNKAIFAASLFNFVFNALFIPQFGIIGAAAVTAVSYLILLCMMGYDLYRLVPFSLKHVLRYLILALGLIAFILGLQYTLPFVNWVEMIIILPLAAALYASALYVLKFITPQEIKWLFSLISSSRK